VGRDEDVVGLRPGGQFLCFQQPAKVGDIRLDDICRLQLEEFTEVIARMTLQLHFLS